MELVNTLLDETIQGLKTEEPAYVKLGNLEKKLSQMLKVLSTKATKSKESLCFITMIKSHDATFSKFHQEVTKLAKMSYFSDQVAFVYEFTREDEVNTHCHLLCKKKTGINKQKYIDTIKRVVKSCSMTDFKDYPVLFYNDKLNYLKGIKDSDQGDKPQITQAKRTKYGVLDIYTCTDL